ncbi:protease modulator HflK [Burkholderia sp. WAC0059]|nr:protease modulator HflK [Burkholderia sp. WAC0059]
MQARGELDDRAGGDRSVWLAAGCTVAFGALAFVPNAGVDTRWCAALSGACLNVFIALVGARLLAAGPARPPVSAPFGKTLLRLVMQAFLRRGEPVDATALLRTLPWQPWVVPLCAVVGVLLAAAAWRPAVPLAPLTVASTLTSTPVSSGVSAPVVVGGVAALIFAFLVLVAERFHARRASSTLAGLLRVVLVCALGVAASAAWFARTHGTPDWPVRLVAVFVGAIAVELAVREALARHVLSAGEGVFPYSTLAGLLRLHPSPFAMLGAELRVRYGIDLRQNWALHSLVRLLPGVVVVVGLAGWLLGGVALLGPGERAVYERFGAPVAVWQPGPHVGLPWPFGRVRVIDNGAIHQLIVSGSADDRSVAAPSVAADADTPGQLNRLWDAPHPWDTTQVVASASGDQQDFQIVSADIRLDYRIGLSDAAARGALYRLVDVDDTVRSIANREVVRYLASRTLPSLLDTNQTAMADTLRVAVQRQLDRLGGGIEVVAVVIESVHPPAGAAAAYHGVQAAQIRADASVVEARGLAAAALGEAQQHAVTAVDDGSAQAAETIADARAQQITFDADVAASRLGGPAFVFEYYLHSLQKGLQNGSMTVIDDRLAQGNRATIDLRPYPAATAPGFKPAW